MKTALITGTSMGIGKALTKIFLENNFKVVGTSRHGAERHFTHKNLKVLKLDIANPKSIEEAHQQIQEMKTSFDVVINNVGIGPDLHQMNPDMESFKKTLDVNITGTIFFTEPILSLIKQGGMLVNVSSKMGSINLCLGKGSMAYCISKSAMNMYSKMLFNAHGDKIKIATLHPGWVKTAIDGNPESGRLTPEESAKSIFSFLNSNFENGIFWDAESNEKLPW